MSAMEEGRPALPELFSLSGKVALVTGSRAGMGRAMAVGLAQAGAEVVLHGHHDDLGETAARIAAAGGKSRQWVADGRHPRQQRRDVHQAVGPRADLRALARGPGGEHGRGVAAVHADRRDDG